MTQPLSNSILAIMYLGDVVFAISVALTAGRHRMDLISYLLIGTITGIGGGNLKGLAIGAKGSVDRESAGITAMSIGFANNVFFHPRCSSTSPLDCVVLDALVLSSFAVVGCYVTLD
ncbi:MAG: TRIC cation channel family protein [Cyanobacteria bacterium P01_H01_bin.15]